LTEIINTELVIVGKGVSALTLSILLKKRGIDHIILDQVVKRNGNRPAIAETLPPSTLVLLESLGLRGHFEANASKIFGHHAVWGSDKIINNLNMD